MRPNATVLRNSTSIEGVRSHLDPRVSVPTFAVAEVVVAMRLRQRLHDSLDCCSRGRIECSLDIDRAIRSIGEAQVPFLDCLTLTVSDTLGVGAVPGVHRVIPEAADAVFFCGFEEWGLVEGFGALR